MHIQLLLTGDEIMAGDIVDSNSAAIAQRLAGLGLRVERKVTLGDSFDKLVSEIQHMAEQADILIINGGLGPTVDDLTAAALGQLIGQPLVEHPKAMAHLQNWCDRLSYTISEANRKQAILPAGVEIIANPVGSAVGFKTEWAGCSIYCTPGVPRELFVMLDQEIIPALATLSGNAEATSTLRYRLFGIGESSLQQLINDEYSDWPDAVELGFRASMPLLELKLTTRNAEDDAIRDACLQRLASLVGDCIVGPSDITLAQRVLQLLQQQGLSITTAESCTGGLIASQITQIAGASASFEAGYVTYSDAIKASTIDVSPDTLARHGAVSEAVALEMATGALAKSGADIAIAVTGIAGPNGGSPEKPVGTVWLAWGSANKLQASEYFIPGERKFIQMMVSAIALDLVRRQLQGIEAPPRYSRYKAPIR